MKTLLLVIIMAYSWVGSQLYSQLRHDSTTVKTPGISIGLYPTYLIPNSTRVSRYNNESVSGFFSLDISKLFSLGLRVDKGVSFISGFEMQKVRTIFTRRSGDDYIFQKDNDQHLFFPEVSEADLKMINYKLALNFKFNIISENKYDFYSGFGLGIGEQQRYNYVLKDYAQYTTECGFLGCYTYQSGSDSVELTRTFEKESFSSFEIFVGCNYKFTQRFFMSLDFNMYRVRFETSDTYSEITESGAIYVSSADTIKKWRYYIGLGLVYRLF